ncbi:7947_t:CDS:2, partial [Ambispora gerdemannii]
MSLSQHTDNITSRSTNSTIETKRTNKLASVEEVRQQLTKAEDQLTKAEAVSREFKEDDNRGKWLEELNGKQRRRERLDEDEREKLKELTEEKKRLEGEVTKWSDEVLKSREDLRQAQAQSDHDKQDISTSLRNYFCTSLSSLPSIPSLKDYLTQPFENKIPIE